MERTIVAFHLDAEGDWVASLDCGHRQHVRHRPPFQMRPWVVDDAQRAGRLGARLDCPPCDRAEMPEGLRLARTSPQWDECSLPAGLRRAHTLGPATWGRLVVTEGGVGLRASATPPIDRALHAGEVQALPPGVEHEVEPTGHVRLFVEFFDVVRDDEREPVSRVRAGTRGSEQDDDRDRACFAHLFCPECASSLRDGHLAGCSQAQER